jgi:hypothetical protein
VTFLAEVTSRVGLYLSTANANYVCRFKSHVLSSAPAYRQRSEQNRQRTEPRTENRTEPRTENRREPRTENRTELWTENRREPRTELRTENRMVNRTEPWGSSLFVRLNTNSILLWRLNNRTNPLKGSCVSFGFQKSDGLIFRKFLNCSIRGRKKGKH